jgi:NADPH:quinone reductase-like Zn-dependent oxidoreductase
MLGVEPNRKWSPMMFESDWDRLLSRNGFTGNDIVHRDYQDERNHMTSVLVSTASGGDQSTKPVPKVVIIMDDNSTTQQAVAKELKYHLEALGSSNCSICSVGDILQLSLEKTLCIFLLELDRPFLASIDDNGYECLQKLVADSHGLLWLTRSGPRIAHDPSFELVIGFARSIRSEKSSIKFTTLSLEAFDEPSKVVENAIKVIKATMLQSHDDVEEEFAEKDGIIYINRIVEANYLNNDIACREFLQRAEPQPFSTKRPLKLTIASPGFLDTLQFVDDLDYEKPLGDNEVELEVKATSMNFIDVMIALAQIPEDFLGSECSGIITRAGKNSRYKPGDRVWTGTIDAYRTYVRTPDALVQQMPNDMSFAEAASLPIVYGTCYYAMYDVARLKAGEKILIHSAAGGIGQAAIWLAKLVQAEIFATVGTEEKKQFLVETFGIPQDHIFSNRNTMFAQEIMHMTNGHGVDVALNSLTGESLRVTWDCMAPFGRFLEIGKKDISSFGNLPMFPFAKNVSFTAVDLLFIMRHDLKLAKRIFDDVKNLAEAKKIKAPQPIHTYSYENIEDAFRVLQSGKHIGKIVIEPKAGEVVPVIEDSRVKLASYLHIFQIVPDSRPTYYFDANATYVIAGGLGGLGRSMARWMVRRGAKSLILLSRSGASTESAQGLVSELKAMGCNVATPQCDISKEQELQAVLSECTRFMPPIKGCIQGAMVLKVGCFRAFLFASCLLMFDRTRSSRTCRWKIIEQLSDPKSMALGISTSYCPRTWTSSYFSPQYPASSANPPSPITTQGIPTRTLSLATESHKARKPCRLILVGSSP